MRLAWKGLATGVAVLTITATAVANIVPSHGHDEHPAPQAASRSLPTVTVFKTPTCGCCKGWAEHVEKHGFKVVARDLADVTPIKTAHGVPESLRTCHTALVGGYVIEGHVPADVIAKLLKERPKVAGLAVPGMPMGSPGMEGPTSERYDVLTFTKAGKTAVYAKK
jgi:hypothetical protein